MLRERDTKIGCCKYICSRQLLFLEEVNKGDLNWIRNDKKSQSPTVRITTTPWWLVIKFCRFRHQSETFNCNLKLVPRSLSRQRVNYKPRKSGGIERLKMIQSRQQKLFDLHVSDAKMLQNFQLQICISGARETMPYHII